MGAVRRNGRGVLDFVKENHYLNKDTKEGVAEILQYMKGVREELQNSLFQFKMEAADVTEYFPTNDNETILRFMENDSTFNLRRRGFNNLLKTVATDTKKKFSDALLATLFTLQYKREFRWPCKKKRNPSEQYVPLSFVNFLKSCLTRMSGLGYIKDEFIDLDFWRSLPGKFRSFKFYGKRVKKKYFFPLL